MSMHLCAKLPWYKPGAVQLGCLVALCLAVQEPSIPISIVQIPTTSAEASFTVIGFLDLLNTF